MSTNPVKVIGKFIESQDNLADFIANGSDAGIKGHIKQQYRNRCDQFGNLPGWAQALGNGTTGTMNRICQPYWDIGGFTGLQPPEESFQGGQCPGVAYNITYQDFDSGAPFGAPVTFQTNGPIELRKIVTGNSQSFAFFRNDVLVRSTISGPVSSNPNTQVTSISRADGQPDDCGNPPPLTPLSPGPNPPPNPGPTPGPEPTDDPSDPTGVPLLPIPDFDDPIGGPTPIVAPDEPGAGVWPEDIPGNTDSSPGGGENIGEPIMVDPGPGGGGDDIDFGEPPAGKAWIGALLQFAIPPAYGIIPGSGPANPVVQRVFGNASLVFENGRGTAYRVNSGNIDLIRPSGALKVTGVYVNCLPGITYNVRPVSLDLCPENNCN